LKEEGKDLVFHTIESENAYKVSTQESWHQRLGHIPGKMIVELKKTFCPQKELLTMLQQPAMPECGKPTRKIPRDSGVEGTLVRARKKREN
jgi:hypothetical protein